MPAIKQRSHGMYSSKQITAWDGAIFENEPYQRKKSFHETKHLHSRLTGKQFSTINKTTFGLFSYPKSMPLSQDTPRMKELRRQKSVPMFPPCKGGKKLRRKKSTLEKKLEARGHLYKAIREYLKNPMAITEANKMRRQQLRARDTRKFVRKKSYRPIPALR